MNKFVFVVCGSKEHIDTLHFSLRYLRHFSRHDILVVTDTSRNEIPVEWTEVIDVKTPAHFTHHQASIYLKVGLPQFLPKGPVYCYLDTDVIALSPECDLIFEHLQAPVTFAADHCVMPKFSLSAVKCECSVQNRKDKAELEALMRQYDPAQQAQDPEMEKKKRELIKKFELLRQNKWRYAWIALRFMTTLKTFKLEEDIYYNRWEKVWHDAAGRVIIPPHKDMFREIEKHSNWRWNARQKRWIGPHGQDVFNPECFHLKAYIREKFGIDVTDDYFQHWNGGVFLFDDRSDAFMKAWFDKTMKIFEDEKWYTRDQGTLIATVWEFGLQHHPLLPRKFNFIADYANPKLMMDKEGYFSDDAMKTKVKPAFVHIYHNFGAKGWDIWDYVESIGQKPELLNEGA